MTQSEDDLAGLPIVSEATRAQSENIQTVLDRIQKGRLVIPDYQRDADQWDRRKQSLFVESLLNNLTIPAFFFSEQSDGKIEVVDGQQRLETIRQYATGEFAISDDEEVVYLSPQCVHYRAKIFDELATKLQNVFNDYPLTIIYLPRGLILNTKLEIFRRINEGGTPLTAQDIRLSYYGTCKSVRFIRMAGVYAHTSAMGKMIQSAKEIGVKNPWGSHPEARQLWFDWWEGKAKSKGQTPSEMFLWYLIHRERKHLDGLVSSPDAMKHLKIGFRGTTEEALDIYCAQLAHTEEHGDTQVFATFGKGLDELFSTFVLWIHAILSRGMPGISVDKYKAGALFIGAAAELELSPGKLSDDAWDAIAEFIRTPRKAGAKWLTEEGGYPEQRGRWTGPRGQKVQYDRVLQLVEHIIKKHP